MSRTTNYQGNNNSFRPETINKDIDRVWLKLQELGVADMLLKIYVDRLHGEQKDYIDNKDQLVRNIISDLRNYVNQQDNGLANSINNLHSYVDQQDNNRNSYFENLISRQGVSLQQLDSYYKHLLQGMANIAADKGWLASLVTDASGKSQQEINDLTAEFKATTSTVLNLANFLTKADFQKLKNLDRSLDISDYLNSILTEYSNKRTDADDTYSNAQGILKINYPKGVYEISKPIVGNGVYGLILREAGYAQHQILYKKDTGDAFSFTPYLNVTFENCLLSISRFHLLNRAWTDSLFKHKRLWRRT
ncbi:hypothetical protein ACO1DV_00030 [Acinetobacter lwoffii]|uniref:hypothetical protein n=1 Tax=Acinetobacter lwoffii TaxID=28090 RepID=UPI003BF667BD